MNPGYYMSKDGHYLYVVYESGRYDVFIPWMMDWMHLTEFGDVTTHREALYLGPL